MASPLQDPGFIDAVTSPQFLALPWEERRSRIAAQVPEFANSSQEDQNQILGMIQKKGNGTPVPPQLQTDPNKLAPFGTPSSGPHKTFADTVGHDTLAGKAADTLSKLSEYLPSADSMIGSSAPAAAEIVPGAAGYLERAATVGKGAVTQFTIEKGLRAVGVPGPIAKWAAAGAAAKLGSKGGLEESPIETVDRGTTAPEAKFPSKIQMALDKSKGRVPTGTLDVPPPQPTAPINGLTLNGTSGQVPPVVGPNTTGTVNVSPPVTPEVPGLTLNAPTGSVPPPVGPPVTGTVNLPTATPQVPPGLSINATAGQVPPTTGTPPSGTIPVATPEVAPPLGTNAPTARDNIDPVAPLNVTPYSAVGGTATPPAAPEQQETPTSEPEVAKEPKATESENPKSGQEAKGDPFSINTEWSDPPSHLGTVPDKYKAEFKSQNDAGNFGANPKVVMKADRETAENFYKYGVTKAKWDAADLAQKNQWKLDSELARGKQAKNAATYAAGDDHSNNSMKRVRELLPDAIPSKSNMPAAAQAFLDSQK